MEHETVPEVAERARPRAIDPARTAAAYEVSTAEQAAIGTAGGPPATALHPSVVMGLQRTAGNAAVTAMLQRNLAETEGEAPEEQEESSPVLDIVGKGRGQPLDPELKDEMQVRLGSDFSDVRIHTDADAAKSAAAVSARAYTVGNEVVFGADSPALDSDPGKRTLAHELTHVVQQRSGPVAGTPTGDGISISDPSDRFEQAADANAERVMADHGNDAHASPAPAAQRDSTEEDEELEMGDEEPVQGTWVQRDPSDTAVQGEDEEEQEELDQADAEEVSEEAAEDETSEAEIAGDEAEAQADDETYEAEEEEAVQGIWVQRDPSDTDTAPADASQPADGASAPSVDDVDTTFNPDEIVSDMAEAGSDTAGAGAGDLAPDESQSESPTATAQALFLQRDPPAPAPAGSSSPQTSDPATGAVPAVQTGSAGKALAALAALPEFKQALEQLKAALKADWDKLVAATTPAEKVVIFTVAGALAGGAAAGGMSNKSSRSFILDQVNNQKIDIPGLSGLSVTPKTANGGIQGGVITVDVYKMFPALQKAIPGVTN